MNVLEVLSVILAASLPIIVFIRKYVHELITCITELRQVTLLAKREATQAKNTADKAATGITAELIDVTKALRNVETEIDNLETDLKELTHLIYHQIKHTDQRITDLHERIEKAQQSA